MARRTAAPTLPPTPSSYATWRPADDGRAPELDELCPTVTEGWLLYCESHEMHANVAREREGRLLGETHAAFLADGCELYLRRVINRHALEAVEDGFAGEAGEPLEPLPTLAD